MQHHSLYLLSDKVPQIEKQLTKQIDTTMKTRTKIIWICLGYLVFTLGLIYRIVRFINGQASTLDLVTAIAMSFSCIYLLALNHWKLLKENKEE